MLSYNSATPRACRPEASLPTELSLRDNRVSDADSTCRFCPACQTETERYANGNCKPCARARTAAWAKANPDKVKARIATYRIAHRDKIKMRKAAYRATNKDKQRAYIAAWWKANPEARRIHKQNRIARRRENGGSLSKDIVAKLFKLQRGKCACCKQPLGNDFHLDHIMPVALGGLNVDSNMQLLRQRCNNQKHAKHPVDFMQERGFLI